MSSAWVWIRCDGHPADPGHFCRRLGRPRGGHLQYRPDIYPAFLCVSISFTMLTDWLTICCVDLLLLCAEAAPSFRFCFG